MQLAHIDFLDDQIATLNTTIAERLSALIPPETVTVPVAADESAGGRAPHVDAAAPLTADFRGAKMPHMLAHAVQHFSRSPGDLSAVW